MPVLVIRRAQLEALAAVPARALTRNVYAHAAKFFPGSLEAMGEAGLKREVDDALAHARAQGFTTARDLCKFVDLWLACGRGFEAAAWARDILAQREDPRRMYRLMGAALAREEQP